jgi:uncharacterized membrane protein
LASKFLFGEMHMNSGIALLLIFGIGFVAGLRAFTAPMAVAWAAHLGWVNLSGSHLSFMSSPWAVGLFMVGALAEYVGDQLPSTPARTTAGPLITRIVMGLLTGACLGVAGGVSPWVGAFVAAVGAVAGAFGGYQTRTRLVRGLHVPDAAIAIPEDFIAIGLGFLCCVETMKFRVALALAHPHAFSRWWS